MKIGQIIKRQRETTINPETGKPFTQEEVADKAGLARETIGKVERGEITNTGIETIGQIAHALGTTPHDLICDDDLETH